MPGSRPSFDGKGQARSQKNKVPRIRSIDDGIFQIRGEAAGGGRRLEAGADVLRQYAEAALIFSYFSGTIRVHALL